MKNLLNENIELFYFSGTGNSKNVCKWIIDELKLETTESKMYDISQLKQRRISKSNNVSYFFVSPTHGFNFPPIMLHFLLRLPKAAANNNVIIMNTRAGMKIGKIFLPGLSGMAQYFSALILLLKGYKIISMKPVDLPSNWISLHPGMKEKVIDSIYTKRESEVRGFIQNILLGNKNFRALYDIIQDILITPVAIAYYFVGRFFLAKTFVASSDCSKCKACVKQCPINAIKWVDNRPYWQYKCESCMHCMNMCPERSIETAHGFIFLFVFIVNSVVIVKLQSTFNIGNYLNEHLSPAMASFTQFFLCSVIMLCLLFPAYRIIHFLMRFSIFEKIIIYTSLTKYKWWRRFNPKNYPPRQMS